MVRVHACQQWVRRWVWCRNKILLSGSTLSTTGAANEGSWRWRHHNEVGKVGQQLLAAYSCPTGDPRGRRNPVWVPPTDDFWGRWCRPTGPAWRLTCAEHSVGGQRMRPPLRGLQGDRRSGHRALPHAWPWRSRQPAQRGCAAPLAAWRCGGGGAEPEVRVYGTGPWFLLAEMEERDRLDKGTPDLGLVRATTSWMSSSQSYLWLTS